MLKVLYVKADDSAVVRRLTFTSRQTLHTTPNAALAVRAILDLYW